MRLFRKHSITSTQLLVSNEEINKLFNFLSNLGYRIKYIDSVWHWRNGNKAGEVKTFDALILAIMYHLQQSTLQSLEEELRHVVEKYLVH